MEQLIIALWAVEAFKGLVAISVVSFLIMGMIGIIAAVSANDNYDKDIWKVLRNLRKYMITCGIIITISILIPSQKIILMYAGVKGGEAVINTPEFEKARELFNKTIDGYLKEDGK